MAKFFHLPQKELCQPSLLRPKAVPESRTYKLRGYSPIGGEKISQSIDGDEVSKLRQVEDVRDMFDFGADVGVPSIREPNMWPSEEVLPGFKDFSLKFFWTCNEAGLNVLRAIALGLDLPETFFTDAHSDHDHLIRYHHYPEVDRKSLVEGTKARVGAHSDYGTMTLLFQDQVGGLEVEHPTNKGQFGKSRTWNSYRGECVEIACSPTGCSNRSGPLPRRRFHRQHWRLLAEMVGRPPLLNDWYRC